MVASRLKSMDSRVLLLSFLVSGLVVGGAATYLGVNMDNVSGQEAGQQLVSTLQKQTGQQYNLVKVDEKSGLYRVRVENPSSQLQTYYVTRDGSLFTNTVTNLNRVNSLLNAQDEFASCLANRDVRLYGNSSQRATVLQVQLLSQAMGSRNVNSIYRNVNNPQNLRQAAQLGITTVPSMYYNGSTLDGVNNLNRIQQFTGCSFNTG